MLDRLFEAIEIKRCNFSSKVKMKLIGNLFIYKQGN